ncbi:MAG: RNA-binding protein [Bacteroidetes bacterium HGW-Bacteroidetes-6]|jgi:ribosome-associated heat shock protein Hsp15|nr:MAG: RNA-binding protein [Bacteroidetes bacterium HGW-Bacteroidetes-6]
MRVDKYLWTVRVFKTRTIATEACRTGRVNINGSEVKAAREVIVGDSISIRLQSFTRTVVVVGFPKARVGAKLVAQYMVDKTPEEEIKKLELARERLVFQRPKGTGRPTKKDRRELDEWMEE